MLVSLPMFKTLFLSLLLSSSLWASLSFRAHGDPFVPDSQQQSLDDFFDELSLEITPSIEQQLSSPVDVYFTIFSYNKTRLRCDLRFLSNYVRLNPNREIEINYLLLLKIQNNHMDRDEFGCTYRQVLLQALENVLFELVDNQ